MQAAGRLHRQRRLRLTLTSSGAKEVDPASPAYDKALRTLRQDDQARLRRLVAPAKPPQETRPPPPTDPPQPPKKMAAPAAPAVGMPTLGQLGGTAAAVPMSTARAGSIAARTSWRSPPETWTSRSRPV